MRRLLIGILTITLVAGCGGTDSAPAGEPEAEAPLLTVEAPEALAVPEPMEVSSEEDWGARVHNKDIEIIGLLNAGSAHRGTDALRFLQRAEGCR